MGACIAHKRALCIRLVQGPTGTRPRPDSAIGVPRIRVTMLSCRSSRPPVCLKVASEYVDQCMKMHATNALLSACEVHRDLMRRSWWNVRSRPAISVPDRLAAAQKRPDLGGQRLDRHRAGGRAERLWCRPWRRSPVHGADHSPGGVRRRVTRPVLDAVSVTVRAEGCRGGCPCGSVPAGIEPVGMAGHPEEVKHACLRCPDREPRLPWFRSGAGLSAAPGMVAKPATASDLLRMRRRERTEPGRNTVTARAGLGRKAAGQRLAVR